MKILIINYEFPPLGGGGGNATQNIAKELTLLGEEIVILTSWFKGLKKTEKNDGYTIIRVGSLRKKLSGSSPLEMLSFVYKAIRYAPSVINEFKPDKVLAFFAIPSGIVAYYIKKRYNIPYIISLHGGDVPGFMPQQLKYYHLFVRGFFRLICENATVITAVSEYLKDLAEKNFSKKVKIFVIKNGIYANDFRPNAIHKKNSTIKIIFVGRFSKEKQIDLLIESFGIIKNSIPNKKIILELIGDGALRKDLENLATKLNIGKDVFFTGWCNKKNLIEKYQSANIFVMPSAEESSSIATLEAMASGLPVAVNRTSGLLELIKHNQNGLFFYNTKESLADILYILITNEALKNKLKKASLETAKKYSWRNAAMQYMTRFHMDPL